MGGICASLTQSLTVLSLMCPVSMERLAPKQPDTNLDAKPLHLYSKGQQVLAPVTLGTLSILCPDISLSIGPHEKNEAG